MHGDDGQSRSTGRSLRYITQTFRPHVPMNYLAVVCDDFEAELVEFDGEDDHVHLLVNYPPKVAVSNLVNSPD